MLVKSEFRKSMGYSFAVLTTTDFWVHTCGYLSSFLKVLAEEKKITHIQFTHYY